MADPEAQVVVTTHDPSTGKAVIHSSTPFAWTSVDTFQNMGIADVYSTATFPVQMNGGQDLELHRERTARGQVEISVKNGTQCRLCSFAPGAQVLFHRTVTLDYGVVLEGSLDLVLDSGEVKVLRRGDVAVQRGTMHSWRNSSKEEEAKAFFVLVDALPVEVGGVELKEDLVDPGVESAKKNC